MSSDVALGHSGTSLESPKPGNHETNNLRGSNNSVNSQHGEKDKQTRARQPECLSPGSCLWKAPGPGQDPSARSLWALGTAHCSPC